MSTLHKEEDKKYIKTAGSAILPDAVRPGLYSATKYLHR